MEVFGFFFFFDVDELFKGLTSGYNKVKKGRREGNRIQGGL